MIFTCDFITHENLWQIASLVTQKSLFMVTHVSFFISIMVTSQTLEQLCMLLELVVLMEVTLKDMVKWLQ